MICHFAFLTKTFLFRGSRNFFINVLKIDILQTGIKNFAYEERKERGGKKEKELERERR